MEGWDGILLAGLTTYLAFLDVASGKLLKKSKIGKSGSFKQALR